MFDFGRDSLGTREPFFLRFHIEIIVCGDRDENDADEKHAEE